MYSKDAKSKNSIEQFKKLVNQLPDITTENEDTIIPDDFPVVETRVNYDDILGLTPNENRKLSGVLNPSNRMLDESRVGDSGTLQIQADHFQETLSETNERITELDREADQRSLTFEEDEEHVG